MHYKALSDSGQFPDVTKSWAVVGVTAGFLKESPKEAGAKQKRECGSVLPNLVSDDHFVDMVPSYHISALAT